MSKPEPYSWEYMQLRRDKRLQDRLIVANKKASRENREPLRPQRKPTKLDTTTLNFGDLV